jgi:hypothetical protein
VDFNRLRPVVKGMNFASFGVDGQVHASDAASILETPEIHAVAAQQASDIASGLPVTMAPITFGTPCDGSARQRGDPRLREELGAVWTLASLAAIAGTPATHASFHATGGPHKILPGHPDEYVPTFSLLQAVGEFNASRVARVLTVNGDSRIVGIALRRSSAWRLLIGNLAPDLRRVRLRIPQHDRPIVTTLAGIGTNSGSSRSTQASTHRIPGYGILQIDFLAPK